VQRADVRIRITFDALRVALLTSALALPGAPSVRAETIHKCVGDGTTYQAQPCGTGQTEVAVHASTPSRAAPVDDVTRTELSQDSGATLQTRAATARNARWLPFRHTSVTIGMTDDEVLNTPDGGVPTTIGRNRDKGTWHEVWTYASRDGARRELTFTNGRLTSISANGEPAQSLRVATVGY
jgi:hypothetical protein